MKIYLVVSLEQIYCKFFATFKVLRRSAFKQGLDITLNKASKIFN